MVAERQRKNWALETLALAVTPAPPLRAAEPAFDGEVTVDAPNEIVRGPYAIFGRNTLGGAVNVITRRRGPFPESEVLVEGGGHRITGRARAHDGDASPPGRPLPGSVRRSPTLESTDRGVLGVHS